MKQLTIFMVMIFAWFAMSSSTLPSVAEAKKEAPSISFKKKVYDFGSIKEADGKVSCEFVFENKGNAPLIIISANAGCGCTQPSYDEAPIAPGKSSAIKVTYNPKGRPGEFTKNITIRTNDPKNQKITLKITGSVIPKGK